MLLTPGVDFIIEHVLSKSDNTNSEISHQQPFKGTLKEQCAVKFESKRMEWITEQTPGKSGVNVIIVDFVDLTDNEFSKAVINLNLNLDTAELRQEGWWKKIKTFFGKVF